MRRVALVVALLWGGAGAEEDDGPVSAFRFRTHPDDVAARIDLKEVMQGVQSRGPDPRDVIPSIRKPEAVPADRAAWVSEEDRVLGMVVNGEARAYPLRILELHEFVNDVLGGVPVGPNY